VGSPDGIAQAEALLAKQPHATGGGDD
jgi:hypothetical protein